MSASKSPPTRPMTAITAPKSLLALPVEILLLIAKDMPIRNLMETSRTCRTFHNLLAPAINEYFALRATPILRWAVLHERCDIIKRALANGANPNGWRRSRTLLNIAATFSNITVAEMLLEAGANPNQRDMDEYRHFTGNRPIDVAEEKGDVEMVELLVRFGAPVPEQGFVFGRPVWRR